MNKIEIKEILLDILFKDAKQAILFFRLEKMGLDFDKISHSFLDNILDLIGYPEETKELASDPFYIMKKGDFCRDYIENEYYEKVLSIYDNSEVTEIRKIGGIDIFIDEDLKIKEAVSDFINWLYTDYDRITNSK